MKTWKVSVLLLVGAPSLTIGSPTQSLAQTVAVLTDHQRYLMASFTYQSAAAEVAIKRQYGSKLSAQRSLIEMKDVALAKLRKAYETVAETRRRTTLQIVALESEIVSLKETQIGLLASKDDGFRSEQEAYRSATYDILRTAEGERALETYLSAGPGSAEAAVQILERVSVKRNAADLRATAVSIGDDALSKGRLTTRFVLEMWRRVVGVDDTDADAWRRVSTLYLQLGQLDDAQSSGERAQQVAKTNTEKGFAAQNLGYVLEEKSLFKQAANYYLEAQNYAARSIKQSGDTSFQDLATLNSTSERVAIVLVMIGDTKEAVSVSQSIIETLSEIDPEVVLDSPYLNTSKNYAYGLHAYTLSESEQYAMSEKYFKLSIAGIEAILAKSPEDGELRETLGELYSDYARSLKNQALYDAAISYSEKALHVAKMLIVLDPANYNYQRDYADGLVNHSESLILAGKDDEASAVLGTGLALAKSFVDAGKKTIPNLIRLGRAHSLAAQIYSAEGSREKAEVSFVAALKTLEPAADIVPYNHELETALFTTKVFRLKNDPVGLSKSRTVDYGAWMKRNGLFNKNDQRVSGVLATVPDSP